MGDLDVFVSGVSTATPAPSPSMVPSVTAAVRTDVYMRMNAAANALRAAGFEILESAPPRRLLCAAGAFPPSYFWFTRCWTNIRGTKSEDEITAIQPSRITHSALACAQSGWSWSLASCRAARRGWKGKMESQARRGSSSQITTLWEGMEAWPMSAPRPLGGFFFPPSARCTVRLAGASTMLAYPLSSSLSLIRSSPHSSRTFRHHRRHHLHRQDQAHRKRRRLHMCCHQCQQYRQRSSRQQSRPHLPPCLEKLYRRLRGRQSRRGSQRQGWRRCLLLRRRQQFRHQQRVLSAFRWLRSGPRRK